MSFLRNIWYAAGWASDLGEELVGRRFLGELVVLYRTADGTARAIGGRCPHRFAPLHLGRKVEDAVECLYHGFRFDGTGRCVLVPDESGPIAANNRVPSYPLVERDRLLWIWMGEPAKADPAAIPDLSDRLSSATYKAVTGSLLIKANYELVADNLIDPRHGQFLHASALQSERFYGAMHEIKEDGLTVSIDRTIHNTRSPSAYASYLDDPNMAVDWFTSARWDPPGIFRLDNGVTPVGCDRSLGIRRPGVHLLTPETETSTHYFFASVRNFRLDDAAADEGARTWQRTVFEEQDKMMLEAVQAEMGTTDFVSLRPVLVAFDGPAMKIRNTMRRLISAEEAARKRTAS
jgi:vanillate O-demethylase monooxygenase subunit